MLKEKKNETYNIITDDERICLHSNALHVVILLIFSLNFDMSTFPGQSCFRLTGNCHPCGPFGSSHYLKVVD